MKKRTITITAELYISDYVQKVTMSKDGKLLLFREEPALHGIADWSNKHMVRERPLVLNYKEIKISVK